MMIKIKPKSIWDNFIKIFSAILFGDMDSCGLFPIISRVSAYGLILYILIFNIQDKVKVLVYFSAFIILAELCWCKFDFCKKLIWHLISLVSLIFFLVLILAQTSSSWNKAYAIESSIAKIIEDAPSAIIVSDKFGIIKGMNSTAENITGWNKEDLVGLPVATLIDPKKVDKHEKAFAAVVKKIEADKKAEAMWIFNNRFNHSFNIVTRYGYGRSVRLYVLAVSFPDYSQSEYNVDFYAIIESD